MGYSEKRSALESCVTDSQIMTINRSVLSSKSDVISEGSYLSTQRSIKEKCPRVAKEYNMYTSSKQIRNIEGDSGKGDSDHDSCAAYDEVFPSNCCRKRTDETASISNNNTEYKMNHHPSSKDDMGPLCTHVCREYGHCDECWMYRVGTNEEDHSIVVNEVPNNTLPLNNKIKLQDISEHAVTRNDTQTFYPADSSDIKYNSNKNLATGLINSRPICHTSDGGSSRPHSRMDTQQEMSSSMSHLQSVTLNTRRKRVIYDMRSSNFNLETTSTLPSNAHVKSMRNCIITDEKYHSFASDGPTDPEVL